MAGLRRGVIGLCVMGLLAVGLAWRHGMVQAALRIGPASDETQRFGPSPPAAPRRVLILGTSLSHQAHWVAELRQALAGCDLEIETVTKPGANSRWGLAALQAWYKDKAQAGAQTAGLVMIEFTANDASLAHGLALPQSRKTHQALIDLARAQGAEVVLATMNPAWGQNFWERPGQGGYFALYRTLAARQDLGLIDSVERWQALAPDSRQRYLPDGLHPSPDAGVAMTTPLFETHLAALYCRPADCSSGACP